MTEDNQHNAGEQQTPMQPQPLPGQVFVRPGIDDRPDYEKTLTEEAKAALKRLAVQQNPRVPEASNERPEVQQTLINTDSVFLHELSCRLIVSLALDALYLCQQFGKCRA